MRQSIALVLSLFVVGCLPAEVTTLRKERINQNLVFVRGGGGNSIVLANGRSAFVFDPKMWPWDAQLGEMLDPNAIDAMYVVNSHAHEDHTQGNRIFPDALIFAASATRDELESSSFSDQRPRGAGIPNVAISKRLRIHVGGEPVLLVHPGAAHTAGDLYAWLPRHKVLVTGDLFDQGFYPHVDRTRGGTFIGYLDALEELCTYPAEIVIPGHGPQARQTDLVAMRDFLKGIQRGIAERRAAGATDDAILDSLSRSNGERLENLGVFSSRRDVVKGFLSELPRR